MSVSRQELKHQATTALSANTLKVYSEVIEEVAVKIKRGRMSMHYYINASIEVDLVMLLHLLQSYFVDCDVQVSKTTVEISWE